VRLARKFHNNTQRRALIFASKCTTALAVAILMPANLQIVLVGAGDRF
jgi:hypothetical protein